MVVLGLAARTYAGPQDEARKLFDLGQKEIDANQIDAACNSFATSLELDPQIGTRLNLADCRERQGKLVEAYQLFAVAIDEAARTHKEGREKYARQRASTLAAKLATIKLHVVAPDVRGLSISLAGRVLQPAQWSAPQVALPGPIAITASAPDREPFRTTVTGVAGGEIALDIPALAPKTAEAPPSPPPQEPAAPPLVDQPAPVAHKSRLPWIVGGVGTALVITSLGIGIDTKSRYDNAFKAGDQSGVSSAETEANVATVVGVVGAAALAVGVVLYVRDRSPDHVAVAPVVTDRSIGIAIGGSL